MKQTLISALFLGISAITVSAAPSILSLRDTISDNSIIYPESFETDTRKMMENWYLQTYTVLDRQADDRTAVPTTDEVYIDRLSKLPTVIEMPYNHIVRDYIKMYTERKQSLVENMLGMSLYYMPIFEQALDRYGLPLELKYLPVIESALNPTAVSRAGATGLWQFMTNTASGLGLEINSLVDERRDPIRSSDAAAKYLKQLYDTYGDWSLAIASYNCGPGNINKALRRAGGGKKDFWEIYPYLPAETRGYVPAFIAANYVMNYYNMHNISPALARRPIITDTVHVTRRVNFHQISDVMNIPMEELRILNPQYRTDVIPGHIKPYTLVLPSIQAYCYIANEDSIVNHDADKYAMRDVVEPGETKGSDNKGEYVEELVVKYHKVKRGETLASIAKKYGVTASSIRKANGIGKKVKRGQKLKINTYKRRYITPAPPVSNDTQLTDTTSSAVQDTIPAVSDVPTVAPADTVERDSVSTAPAGNTNIKEPAGTSQSENTATPKSTVHKVKSGESLSKIASRYGVTVNDIKKANNLNSDNIRAGQKLKIPAKKTVRTKRRRRR